MRREAVRTLHSLTTKYQTDISEDEYEVIVVDSNSSQPLNSVWIESIPESNCFSVAKETLLVMGGFDENFKSVGGGLTLVFEGSYRNLLYNFIRLLKYAE